MCTQCVRLIFGIIHCLSNLFLRCVTRTRRVLCVSASPKLIHATWAIIFVMYGWICAPFFDVLLTNESQKKSAGLHRLCSSRRRHSGEYYFSSRVPHASKFRSNISTLLHNNLTRDYDDQGKMTAHWHQTRLVVHTEARSRAAPATDNMTVQFTRTGILSRN